MSGLFQRYMGSYQGCGARIFSCGPRVKSSPVDLEYVVAKLSNEPFQ